MEADYVDVVEWNCRSGKYILEDPTTVDSRSVGRRNAHGDVEACL